MTCAAASPNSSQFHLPPSGTDTPAFFNTSGLAATEKFATPIGAPTSVPAAFAVFEHLRIHCRQALSRRVQVEKCLAGAVCRDV